MRAKKKNKNRVAKSLINIFLGIREGNQLKTDESKIENNYFETCRMV